MEIYLPNIIVLLAHLCDRLEYAANKYWPALILLYAAMAWAALELFTPLGPVWGQPEATYPPIETAVWGTIAMNVCIVAITLLTRRLTHELGSFLAIWLAYCALVWYAAGVEYAAWSAVFMSVSAHLMHWFLVKKVGVVYEDTTTVELED